MADRQHASPATNLPTVLVIDDEPGHRLMVRAVLEDAGWQVLDVAAGHGNAALAAARRQAALTSQLPDALDMLGSALRSGYALTRGFQVVSSQMHPPISEEFERVLQDVQVGISVSEALDGLLLRTDSYDLELVVAAMQTQLTMGGNLSEVLDKIAHMIRERVRLQGEINAATSEGRMSAGILIAMPIVMCIAISAVNPHYLDPLFSERLGIMMLMGAGMLTGSILMSVWGGPKNRKVLAVIGFIMLATLGFIVTGLQPNLTLIGVGVFILTFFIPFASGPSSAIFATKVAPEVQGRVFATRSMVSQSMMPLAFILSGILADRVFNPLLVSEGPLASTFVGRWVGVGPGRGIGLMIICSGLVLLLISLGAYANPRIRNIETEIPDAISDAEDQSDDLLDLAEDRAPFPVSG